MQPDPTEIRDLLTHADERVAALARDHLELIAACHAAAVDSGTTIGLLERERDETNMSLREAEAAYRQMLHLFREAVSMLVETTGEDSFTIATALGLHPDQVPDTIAGIDDPFLYP